MKDLLPDIREISEFYIFQQDGAPAHRARETVALLTNETPNFIIPTQSRPEPRRLQNMGMHAGNGVQNKDLRKRIMQAWNELAQRIIDSSVRQWRKRLRACVVVKGEQFEYKL